MKQLSKESQESIRKELSKREDEFTRYCVLFESDFVFYFMSAEDCEAYDENIPHGGGFDWSVFDDLTGGRDKY